MEGNLVTTLAFLLWVPVCLYFAKRYRPAVAAVLAILGGAMALPELIEFAIPGLPPFDKRNIPTLWLLIGFAIWRPEKLRVFASPLFAVLCILFLVGGLGTALTNTDGFAFGPRVVAGLQAYETVHLFVADLTHIIVPFMVGYSVCRTEPNVTDLLRTTAALVLLYSVPFLIELRMSPQLHNWVYGFHQHDFGQSVRGGGYRPLIFMSHGLAVSLLVATTFVGSVALGKNRVGVGRFRPGFAPTYLGAMLLLCKSLAAGLYGVLTAPFVWLAKPRTQVIVATVLALLAVSYPFASAADLVPVEWMLKVAKEQAGEDRWGSLKFRFDNEVLLIKRANLRPTFGWGEYCRACVFDVFDGSEISIRDGHWIILLGDRGLFGYGLAFGLLAFPVVLATFAIRKVRGASGARLMGALALMVAVSLVDLIPNGLFTVVPYLNAGALLGFQRGARDGAPGRRKRRRGTKRVVAHASQKASMSPIRSGSGSSSSSSPTTT